MTRHAAPPNKPPAARAWLATFNCSSGSVLERTRLRWAARDCPSLKPVATGSYLEASAEAVRLACWTPTESACDRHTHEQWARWLASRAARARTNPSLPVIYVTGDSESSWAARGVPNSILLAKLFAIALLVRAIATLMNSTWAQLP